METKLPKDIFSKIRHIEIASRKLVESLFSGEYHSVFKGAGIEFAEVRPYQPGDDVRAIDWNVTARTGSPFIKIFNEEREQTLILMVDASASGNFGTKEKFKTEVSAEICATLAFSAIKNGDKVGLLIFTESVELYIPPSKGRKHVLRIIREILYFKPKGKGTNMKDALEKLNSTLKKRAIVFLLSDFQTSDFEKPMRIAAKRHDMIAVELSDPAENDLPDAGFITLIDAESGEKLLVDSSSSDFRKSYGKIVDEKNKRLEKFLNSNKIDRIKISADQPAVDPLIRFFKKREKRLATGR